MRLPAVSYSTHAVCTKLAWSMFCGNLKLSELDKLIQTIKELSCVNYGLISLPLFHVDFMLESLVTVYSVTIFTVLLSVSFYDFHIKYILEFLVDLLPWRQ